MKQPELDLFGPPALGAPEWIGKQTLLLPGFALDLVEPLLPALRTVLRAAPFRNQLTPGGRTIEVAVTNCGPLGWVSDRLGYRYSPFDPLTGKPWPALPELLAKLAGLPRQTASMRRSRPGACSATPMLRCANCRRWVWRPAWCVLWRGSPVQYLPTPEKVRFT